MSRRIALLIAVAVAVLALAGLDIAREPDRPDSLEIALDLLEKLVLVAAMVGVAWSVTGLRSLHEDHRALQDHVARGLAKGEDWRRRRASEIAALSDAIDAQFTAWGLSAAERDVAGLMLKGMSLKEIALARDTADATIRQQAQAVYRKAGLSGRAELSAYFLDSLFDLQEPVGPKLLLTPGGGPA